MKNSGTRTLSVETRRKISRAATLQHERQKFNAWLDEHPAYLMSLNPDLTPHQQAEALLGLNDSLLDGADPMTFNEAFEIVRASTVEYEVVDGAWVCNGPVAA